MKLYYLPLLLDTVFFALSGFVLSFIFVNYFMARPFSIIFAVCFGLILAVVCFAYLKKKGDKLKLNRLEKKELERVILQLNLSSKNELINIFSSALTKMELSFERKNNALYIKQNSSAMFFHFGFEQVGKVEIVKAFNLVNKGDTAIIFSDRFSEEVISFAERFDGKIQLKNGSEAYKFLKEASALPSQDYKLSAVKKQRKKLIFFSKKRAVKYLTFGLIFLASAFFVPFKTYYVVCGSAMLVFSVICRLFGKTDATTTAG